MNVPIQNKRHMAIRTAVLRTLYTSAILTTAILAPKTTRLLAHLDRGKIHRTELYKRIRAAETRLKHEGLVSEEAAGRLALTERGKTHIERILIRDYVIPEQALWDGKWRILFFDIREKRRKVRARLRLLLQSAGFVRLQDSVWVHPYSCDEYVALIRTHLSSGVGEMRVVVADAIEADGALREHFKL